MQNTIRIITEEYMKLDKMLNKMDRSNSAYDYILGGRNGLLLVIRLLENKPIDRA